MVVQVELGHDLYLSEQSSLLVVSDFARREIAAPNVLELLTLLDLAEESGLQAGAVLRLLCTVCNLPAVLLRRICKVALRILSLVFHFKRRAFVRAVTQVLVEVIEVEFDASVVVSRAGSLRVLLRFGLHRVL